MATAMSVTISSTFRPFLDSNKVTVGILPENVLTSRNATTVNFCTAKHSLCRRSLNSCNFPVEGHRCLSRPISAVGSGLEASITDPKGNGITVKNAKIVVESQDDDKIQLRVDLTGEETQIVFDKVLTNLARTAPPIPGFRRQKGDRPVSGSHNRLRLIRI
ncbi:unnamed protein product [Ilex paraguariensis]|uniref:Uncharacterized protein n=1 Tax=Ilex paraguariensis TaxID=185542 RepID=A0ABC8SWT5_9AQUA